MIMLTTFRLYIIIISKLSPACLNWWWLRETVVMQDESGGNDDISAAILISSTSLSSNQNCRVKVILSRADSFTAGAINYIDKEQREAKSMFPLNNSFQLRYNKKKTHPRVLTEVTNGLISGFGPTVECQRGHKGVRRKEEKFDVFQSYLTY